MREAALLQRPLQPLHCLRLQHAEADPHAPVVQEPDPVSIQEAAAAASVRLTALSIEIGPEDGSDSVETLYQHKTRVAPDACVAEALDLVESTDDTDTIAYLHSFLA